MKKTLAIVTAVVVLAGMAYFVNHANATDTQRMASVMASASGTQP